MPRDLVSDEFCQNSVSCKLDVTVKQKDWDYLFSKNAETNWVLGANI